MRRVATIVVALALAGLPVESAIADEPATPRSFTFLATGDLLPENAVLRNAAKAAAGTGARYDFAALFAPVAPLVRAADLAVCHMEVPLGVPGQRPGRYGKSNIVGNRLLGPYELATGVAATGFDRCSTASNHTYDLREAGITSTLEALDDAGLTHTGSAREPAEAAPVIFSVNGVRVAHLSYTNLTNNRRPKEDWRIAFGDLSRVAADVAAVRADGAEVVIVSVHMGVEGARKASRKQRTWAQAVTTQADIDLIVMHHPHTIHPVEQVNGTWVFWSLGNFVSGMGPGRAGWVGSSRTLDGLLAQATFLEDPEQPGRFTTTITPLVICVEPATRAVYPATATLADPTITSKLRRTLTSCLTRTRALVPTAT